MKIRAMKQQVCARQHLHFGTRPFSPDERMWLDIAPVGREFGSPDYEQFAQLDAPEQKDTPL